MNKRRSQCLNIETVLGEQEVSFAFPQKRLRRSRLSTLSFWDLLIMRTNESESETESVFKEIQHPEQTEHQLLFEVSPKAIVLNTPSTHTHTVSMSAITNSGKSLRTRCFGISFISDQQGHR